MNYKEVQVFLEPQFGFLAKSNGEQLWMHHYTVWSAFRKFVEYIPSIDEDEGKIIEVACLLHDIAKMSEKNQSILKGKEKGKVVHKPTIGEFHDYLELIEGTLPFPLTDENTKNIFDIVLTHHSISEDDLREITTNSAGILTELLRYADWLASMETVSPMTINRIRKVINGLFDLSYFEISRFTTPTTYLFLDKAIEIYKGKGWETLLVFDNGVVFIGERCEIPEKEEIVDHLLHSFFDMSLTLQSVYPPMFTKNILAGLSELFPSQFMKVGDHEQSIKDNLGNIDRKGVQFLRLLYDIFNLKGINKVKKELPFWDLIPSCLGPSGHPKAKRIWSKYFDEDAPESINTDIINGLLERIKVKDIIPERYDIPVDYDKYLSKLTPDELFSVLYTVAISVEEEVSDTEAIKRYFGNIISLEEIKDFRSIAEEAFERYKKYKKTTDASKGICERCGCPISIIAKPALMFPKGGGYGFSQIKANPKNAISTCPFCACDNMILRDGLRSDNLRIFVRIESKVPELINMYHALDKLITNLQNGLRYPSDIMRLEGKEDLRDVPFPKRLKIPIAKQDYPEVESVLTTERGALFNIERLAIKNFSPKDYKAKYEPLYHLLNLLGFRTSIGTEEQVGLFGENIITTESDYYRSLAIIILASVLYKNRKKYIFAKNMLEKSPSVALKFVSETKKESNNLRINEKLARRFFEFLYKSEIALFNINGGEYSMKDLLEDAAFFADKEGGIPHFCVEPMDRGEFWRNLTRHKAAKPISDALNEMLKGGDEGAFERAIAAFMRNLAKMISGEEKEEQNEFVGRSVEILKKFWELRKEDISGFIRDKNALTSTIYVFTRYSNLKEVFESE